MEKSDCKRKKIIQRPESQRCTAYTTPIIVFYSLVCLEICNSPLCYKKENRRDKKQEKK